MARPAIGFIGLGTMGGAMCRHVIEADFPVTVWARSQDRAASHLDDGAGWATSAKDLATSSDIIILCVSNDAAVEDLVFGQNGVASGEVFGKTLVK